MPREGHDATNAANSAAAAISIHVPREGHDDVLVNCLTIGQNFNPRAPRGARPNLVAFTGNDVGISIHVPREGHD